MLANSSKCDRAAFCCVPHITVIARFRRRTEAERKSVGDSDQVALIRLFFNCGEWCKN